MVAKTITQIDLNNLEIRVKSEVSKEQTELRHEDRKKLSEYIWKVDAIDKKQAVNDNIVETMTDSISKLEKVVTEGFEKINTKIDGFSDKFATKDDHKENSIRISSVEKALENINIRIASVSGGFAVIIFLIEKFSK